MGSGGVNGSELTAEDYAAVLGAMRSLSATYGARTLNEALSEWRLTVIDLEEGFGTEWIREYHDELTCRDWLHAAWPLLTPRVREVRRAELDEWDRRFVAATLPRRKADGLPAGMDGRWWHDRYPRRITGEPGHDLPPGWSPAPVHADDD